MDEYNILKYFRDNIVNYGGFRKLFQYAETVSSDYADNLEKAYLYIMNLVLEKLKKGQ